MSSIDSGYQLPWLQNHMSFPKFVKTILLTPSNLYLCVTNILPPILGMTFSMPLSPMFANVVDNGVQGSTQLIVWQSLTICSWRVSQSFIISTQCTFVEIESVVEFLKQSRIPENSIAGVKKQLWVHLANVEWAGVGGSFQKLLFIYIIVLYLVCIILNVLIYYSYNYQCTQLGYYVCMHL